MRTSETIDKLAPALVKAREALGSIVRNKENAAFKSGGKTSRYADLEAVLEAIEPALAQAKLTLHQGAEPIMSETAVLGLNIVTRAIHESGQWMEAETFVPIAAGGGPQQGMAALTYGRRGGLKAFWGLAEEDDDGNAAQGTTRSHAASTPNYKPAATQTTATAGEGGSVGGDLGSFEIKFGKFKGKSLDLISTLDGGMGWMEWLVNQPDDEKGPSLGKKKVQEYLSARGGKASKARTPATQAAIQAAREVGFDDVPEALDGEDDALPFDGGR